MRAFSTAWIVLIWLCHPIHADAVSPVPDQSAGPPAEPHWELFLDDHILTRSTGFQRVVHQPKARGIVLEGTEAWEEPRGVTQLYVGSRKDGGYEMYYRGHGGIGPVTAYAVSDDGIHWEKP